MDLTVIGDLTIEVGGAINADGLGYAGRSGPGAAIGLVGGSYGGMGGDNSAATNPALTYGAITSSTNIGSGGGNHALSFGGGAVRLTVMGTSTVNGLLSSGGVSGEPQNRNGGSGGSVFVTTGALTGNGTLRANGGGIDTAGGGGRVAVILTNSTSIGSVKLQAYTGAGAKAGAAGTVYLQTATQGAGRGTLTIDANNVAAAGASITTLISSNVTGTTVGTVVITNKAVLQLDTNAALTVNGSWLNSGVFLAAASSTVYLAGGDVATVSGSNTFAWLVSTNATGKAIFFQVGSTNRVREGLVLNGPELRSTEDGSHWYLTLLPGAMQDVHAVRVKDSDASMGQEIVARSSSMNFGHNQHWRFVDRFSFWIVVR
jgi:hypothetical protein